MYVSSIHEKERVMKKNIALWLLQITVATVFVISALPKLAGVSIMVQMFDALGLGQGFRYVTAALEIGGAVMLLVPTLAGLGAVVLAIVMVGAILAHVLVLGGSAVPAIVLLAATVSIGWFRVQQAPSRVPGLIQTRA
jgi:putative oxidoreductase